MNFEQEGYSELKEINGRGLCGLYRFIYTVGLVIGITEDGYVGRYCFDNKKEASEALKNWDGIDDPKGNWIKYKGKGGERRNEI